MEGEEEGYVFRPQDLFDFYFGFVSGALNTLPVGSNLNTCGKNLRLQQEYVVDMLGYMGARDIVQVIDKMAKYLYYINFTVVPCYRGTKEILFNKTLENLFGPELNIIDNVFFGAGFMWTDIVMLTLATPTNTVSSYPFYLSFYVGDFLFRFIFKSELDTNCWFPWEDCRTAAEEDLKR